MIDVYTTEPHYVDHIAPIWRALPDRLRGTWYADRGGYARARQLDVEGLIRQRRPSPADTPTIIASHMDERNIKRPFVFVEHGTGQHYDGLDASSLGAARRNVVAYLAPNADTADRMAAQFPNAAITVVGCPKLDQWTGVADRVAAHDDDPTVAFGWHWDGRSPEARSARRHYMHAVPRVTYDMLGHGHPRIWNNLESWYQRIGVEPVKHFADVLDRAHVYAADNTSTMFEAAAVGLPVVVLNAPWYRRDVDHGIRFWQWANIGPNVDRPGELNDAIGHAWTERDWYADFRADMAVALYPNLGSATDIAAAAIVAAYDGAHV